MLRVPSRPKRGGAASDLRDGVQPELMMQACAIGDSAGSEVS